MNSNLEYGLENDFLQSNSSKSLLDTINTGFDNSYHDTAIVSKPELKKLNRVLREDSILDTLQTGFGADQTIIIECKKKPKFKTHLCKELYLGEFESETEKTLARTNLDVYSKKETHIILSDAVSNLITKNEVEEIVKDLNYTTSRSKSYANYIIPDNLFK